MVMRTSKDKPCSKHGMHSVKLSQVIITISSYLIDRKNSRKGSKAMSQHCRYAKPFDIYLFKGICRHRCRPIWYSRDKWRRPMFSLSKLQISSCTQSQESRPIDNSGSSIPQHRTWWALQASQDSL